MKYNINPDIKKAETLPASFYLDEDNFKAMADKIFAVTWQWIGDHSLLPGAGSIFPFTLLDGYLKEPLLLTKDKDDTIHCLSNVCTHRANLLIQTPNKANNLICGYHGRKFDLNGKFRSMPEFAEAEDFPRPCDSLKTFSLESWGPFLFVGISPKINLDAMLKIMEERIGFLPLHHFKYEPTLSKDYLVNAHWALYCDNYLEGFHIPFVHKDLNAALDYGSYSTVLFENGSLQIGYAAGAEETFDLPKNHIDFGKHVAAYYYWLFPNMMFNFYPWGLSINIVKPIGSNKTKVSFLTYVYDEEKLNRGAGALLDKVEREDEFVVEGVQKGLQSRAYTTGRFSPTREQGVHHFHRLLADFMN